VAGRQARRLQVHRQALGLQVQRQEFWLQLGLQALGLQPSNMIDISLTPQSGSQGMPQSWASSCVPAAKLATQAQTKSVVLIRISFSVSRRSSRIRASG